MIPLPQDFLDAVTAHVAAKLGRGLRPHRLATVDPDYAGSGAPAVIFDGEEAPTGKGYPLAGSGSVAPGERVIMAPVGSGYVISGRLNPGSARSFSVTQFGANVDGVTDDTAAIQAAVDAAFLDGALPIGGEVVLPPGTARISAPIQLHPYVTLRGSYPMRGTNHQGSCIKALPTFSGNALVKMVGQAAGGYLGVSYGQRVRDLTLDGEPARGAGVPLFSGIRAEGSVRGVILQDVSVTECSDRGVVTASSGGAWPYSWQLENVQVSNVGVDGFRMGGATDTTMIGCRAIGVGRHGFYLDNMANAKFIGCRAEWSGEYGWWITANWGTGTGSGGATWVGCSTDRSGKDGFRVDATGTGPLTFAATEVRRDGRNGGAGFGGYAGFHVVGATTPVVLSPITCFPGVDDDGTGVNSPQYGVRVASATSVSIDSGSIHAANTATADGGGNARFYIAPGVYRRTGSTAAPVVVP